MKDKEVQYDHMRVMVGDAVPFEETISAQMVLL